MQQSGFSNVYNLDGSIFAWANEGRPVYRGDKQVDEVHPYNQSGGTFCMIDVSPKNGNPIHSDSQGCQLDLGGIVDSVFVMGKSCAFFPFFPETGSGPDHAWGTQYAFGFDQCPDGLHWIRGRMVMGGGMGGAPWDRPVVWIVMA